MFLTIAATHDANSKYHKDIYTKMVFKICISRFSELMLYRDYPGSASVYQLTDSGGECGVPYESYFQMPVSGKDQPWYSIEQGPIHFTIISTENTWTPNSAQVSVPIFLF